MKLTFTALAPDDDEDDEELSVSDITTVLCALAPGKVFLLPFEDLVPHIIPRSNMPHLTSHSVAMKAISSKTLERSADLWLSYI